MVRSTKFGNVISMAATGIPMTMHNDHWTPAFKDTDIHSATSRGNIGFVPLSRKNTRAAHRIFMSPFSRTMNSLLRHRFISPVTRATTETVYIIESPLTSVSWLSLISNL